MKHIKIIILSAIILFCCAYPIASAEINESTNNTNVAADDSLSLNAQNSGLRLNPDFQIDGEDSYHQGDKMRFHVTFHPCLYGSINVYIDDDFYQTTVTSDTGQFYITLDGHSKRLSPGTHFFKVVYSGDDEWYYDECTFYFTIE